MVEITVELDTSQIGKLGSIPKQAIPRFLSQSAQKMTERLQRNSPVDEGVLKQWAITSLTDTEAHIKSPAKYAIFVDQGTKAHWIEPVNKKALHWMGTGTFYAGGLYHSHGYGGFSKGHMVGGIQGRHFVDQSFEELQEFTPGFLMRAIEEVQG